MAVFSAFRLLRYLLRRSRRIVSRTFSASSVPFGYCGICYFKAGLLPKSSIRRLQCLSAIAVFVTVMHGIETTRDFQVSSVPFGYCGICYSSSVSNQLPRWQLCLQCLSAIAVFVTVYVPWRLVRDFRGSSVPFGYCGICYPYGQSLWPLTRANSLQCLSAIAVFVTRRIVSRTFSASRSRLQCLSAIAVFVTLVVSSSGGRQIQEVFSAFRLLRYLLLPAFGTLAISDPSRSSVPFGYCGICYLNTAHRSALTRGGVFSAFRLLRYLLQGPIVSIRSKSLRGLQCLSAIAVFVTLPNC